jgi:eukaryotic-like serine/threonine-protein kinase
MTSPSQALQDRLSAALAGQYTIERVLGVGGMGTVFLGRDTTLDRPVAIKVISPDVTGSAELRQRFLLEARTVARLRHPNIVSVYSAGESGDLLWFAMEFVPGESLRDRQLREPVLPADDVVAIMHDLALALDDAHVAGIVHRDVKPENILLDRDTGRAMLTDFGVARALSAGDGRLTGVGFVLGSPRYMSPEQAAGDANIDGRSDLYSLGLVAYELLAGHPVVQAETPTAILVKHLTEEATPITQVKADVPPVLASAIMRTLAKKPEERFTRGRALAAALEGRDPDDPSVASGRRSLGTTKSAPAAPAAAGRKRLAGAALVATVAAAGVWFAVGRDAGAEGADNANTWLVAPFELQTSNSSLDWLREGAVNMLGLTLSQWNDLSVVDYERTLDLLRSVSEADQRRLGLDAARQMARQAKAGAVIMGQITTANDSLFVVARRYDVASGDRIEETTAGAPLDSDPRVLFERLARELLDLAGGPALTVELAQQTTASVEAYRLYLEGVRALNGFRLAEADVSFARAIALDSTFALAYYKRALGLGWSNRLDTLYENTAQRAVQFGGRVPPRMREVFAGNLDLARGFLASTSGSADSARRFWDAASQRFQTLATSDSSDLDAWYGLADANYHAATGTGLVDPDSITRLLNRSLTAFERTIAIDSSFHLAYQHLVSLYQFAASERGGLVLDSGVLRVRTDEMDSARVQRLVRDAQERTKRFAERWIAEDPDSPQAWQSLLDTYAVMRQFDSAVALIDRTRTRPTVYSPSLVVYRSLYRLLQERPDSLRADLNEMLQRFPAESLGVRTTTPGALLPFVGMTSASAVGALGLLDSLASRSVEASPTFPRLGGSTREIADFYSTANAVAAGVPMTPTMRTRLTTGITRLSGTGPLLTAFRTQALGVPYSAYLTTRDTTFARTALTWATERGADFFELEALLALDRGDSSVARAKLAQISDTAGYRGATLGLGGVRALTRAELLTRLGDTRRAIALYEIMRLENLQMNMGEPGITLYVRSRLALGRLLEQEGERERALAAYESFERFWRDADSSLQGELREARASMQRLRDAGTTTTIRPRAGS